METPRFVLGGSIFLPALLAVVTGCGWMSQGQNSEGVRLFQQGSYDGATQRFHQAIQSDPKNPDGYYNLAAVLHRQGKLQNRPVDLAQAESYYRQCLDRDPNHVECRRGLAVLLVEEGRSQEAFTMMEEWVARSPQLASAKVETARLFEEFGDPNAAKEYLISALAVDPGDSRALAALGKMREEAGDHAQALANYQRSMLDNKYQPQLAQRVAALQGAGVGTTSSFTPASGGTRLATQPVSNNGPMR